jgi:hypothetical protein
MPTNTLEIHTITAYLQASRRDRSGCCRVATQRVSELRGENRWWEEREVMRRGRYRERERGGEGRRLQIRPGPDFEIQPISQISRPNLNLVGSEFSLIVEFLNTRWERGGEEMAER